MSLVPFTSLVANIMTYLIYPIIRKRIRPPTHSSARLYDTQLFGHEGNQRHDVFTFSRKNCGIVYADSINRLNTSFDVNTEDRQVTLQLKRRYE